LPLYYTAASQTSNLNISSNSKPNSKIFQGMNQCFRWVRLMKKTRAQKSRATVPLSDNRYFTIIATYFAEAIITFISYTK
jgi:hypothetical protein